MIISKNNNCIKNVRKLLTSSKDRSKQGLFVVEGERIVSEVPQEMLQKVFVAESKTGLLKQLAYQDLSEGNNVSDARDENDLFMQNGRVEMVSDEVFSALSDTVHPQGILAVVKQPEYTLAQILDVGYNPSQSEAVAEGFNLQGSASGCGLQEKRSVFVLLDDIRDPGNLGTIIRTCEATGVRGVIMSKGCVDLFNPKVVRSTMGSIFRVPFVVCDLPEAIGELKKRAYQVYGTSLDASKDFRMVDYGRNCAVITGNEAKGIRPEVLSLTTENIHIPMQGKVESLNAAVSLAVVLFHLS